MDVEEVLETIDGWGRYQKTIYFLACLPCIIGAFVTMGYSWTAFVMDHRCLVEGCEDISNATYTAPFLNHSTPHDDAYTWSRCSVYKRSTPTGCGPGNFTRQTEPCTHWVYDTSVMEITVVSQFDLVCDSESLRPLGGSVFFVGVAVGSILSGVIADRYGRMMALMVNILFTTISSTAAAFAPNYDTFTALRSISAIFQFGLFSAPFVLSMEITSIELRAFCGIMINVFFAIGEALAGVFPIFVKDWKALQLIYSLPTLLFCSYWFFMPESPRWFMAVNKPDKAEQVLRKIAKWNRTKFPEELVMQDKKTENPEKPSGSSDSFIDVLKTPILLKRACILSLQWSVVALVYYGIGMVSTDLGGDVYVNFILTMLIEIPSYLFCAFTINPLGRKLMMSGAFALSGLGTIGAGLVPDNGLEWLVTTLALVGKFGAASAFALVYVYTAELYPDRLRSIGVGVASASGRIGSILAPFVSDLGQDSITLPLCIFGVAGLVASAVTFVLPETSGHDLPTNIAEAANFGRDQSLLPIPCLMARRRRKQTELRGYDGPELAEKTQDGASGSDGDVQRA